MTEEQQWRIKMVGITQEQWDWINSASSDPQCPTELPPFQEWFTKYARIKDRRGEMITPTSLSEDQLKFVEVAEWCLENERPIRILWVTRAQVGRTTLTLAFLCWMAKRNRIHAKSVCFVHSQMDSVRSIMSRLTGSLQLGGSIVFENGSELEVMKVKIGDEFGRSETIHNIHVNLGGQKYEKNGIDNLNLFKNVPPEQETCVVIEGRHTEHNMEFIEGLWENAIPFEDFKKDRGWRNGYVKIFSPD